MEKGANHIADGLVAALDGTVLVRRVGTGKLYGVPKILKKFNDATTATEFTTLIETDSFVGDIGIKPCEPLIEEFNGWAFIDERLSVYHTTIVVRDEDVTSFTFDADIRNVPIRIFRFLYDECHVDGERLVTLSGFTRFGG